MTIRNFCLVCIIAALFASACSKKNSPQPGSGTGGTDTTKTTGTGGTTTPTTKTYLPVSVYVSNTHDTTKKLVYTLTYDDKNRIIQNTYGGNDTIGFKYDDQNRLIEQDDYDTHHVVYYATTYTYTNDSIINVSTTHAGAVTSQSIYHLKNGLLVKIEPVTSGGGLPVNFTYDANKNVIQEETISYTYDNKKSPFSMVVGFQPLFVAYNFDLTYPGNNVNNRLTNPTNQWTMTYTFNKDGFPTKMRVAQTGYVGYYYYWYNYQVK